jgi:hypothetical protein
MLELSNFKPGDQMENSRRSKLLDALAGQPLTHVNAVLKRLARDNTSAEATGESITIISIVSKEQLSLR